MNPELSMRPLNNLLWNLSTKINKAIVIQTEKGSTVIPDNKERLKVHKPLMDNSRPLPILSAIGTSSYNSAKFFLSLFYHL